MKKILTLALAFAWICNTSSSAQSELLDNGFSLKFSFGFPGSAYGFDGDIPIPDGLSINTTYGLELGNQWYFLKKERFGLGLDINWIDILYGNATTNDPLLGSIKRITMEGSFLEVGPVATFALNDKFAIEGYYNLRPTYMASYFYENSDDFVLIRDFSIAHAFGIGARIKILYIGYEYTFGSFNGQVDSDGEYEDVADDFGNQNMAGGNSKLVIGLQF